MLKTRTQRFAADFDRLYGQGRWDEFCRLVMAHTRPGVIRAAFPTAKGQPMSSPTYGKWEARAWEVAQ